MKDKEQKAKILKEISSLARELIGDKVKGKPVAMEIEMTAAVPKKKMSKEELKKKLGLS